MIWLASMRAFSQAGSSVAADVQLVLRQVEQLLAAAPAAALVQRPQPFAQGVLGPLLRFAVEGGEDLQAALVEQVVAVLGFQVLARVLGEIVGQRHGAGVGRLLRQPHRQRLLVLLDADQLEQHHLQQHVIAPLEHVLRPLEDRVDAVGVGDDAGDQGRFGDVDPANRLAEIVAGRGLDAVDAAAEEDLVAVEGHDLVFGVLLLDLDGQQHLAQLARQGELGGEEEAAGQLLGDRAAAAPLLAQQHAADGADGAAEVDPPVGIELVVLGGDDRLLQDRRDVVAADDDALLDGEVLDGRVLVVVEGGHDHRLDVLQVLDLREALLVDQDQAEQDPQHDRQQQADGDEQDLQVFAEKISHGALPVYHIARDKKIAPPSRRGRAGLIFRPRFPYTQPQVVP